MIRFLRSVVAKLDGPVEPRPSFRRWADSRRLLIALTLPWAFAAIALTLYLWIRYLNRGTSMPEWLNLVAIFNIITLILASTFYSIFVL